MARKTYEELEERIRQLEKMEESLREAEWKFQALFENGPIGVAYHRVIYDDAGKPVDYYFIDVNRNYVELTGVDPRGKLVTEAFPGIENGPFDWIGTFGRVGQTGESIRFQQHFELDDRWYDLVGYQYKPDHFVGAFLDITDQKRAEESMRSSEERFRRLFERSSDAILVVNKRTDQILDANLAAQRLTARSHDELTDLTTPDVAAAPTSDQRNAVIESDDSVDLGQMIFRRPDDTERVTRLVSVPLDEDSIFAIARDITDELALEDRYRQSQKMEAIGHLAGGVAHDFNNILVPVIGYAELAMMRLNPDDEFYTELTHIKKSAERAADLTRQILAFGRRQMLELRVLDLDHVINSLRPMLVRLIKEDIDLQFHRGPRLAAIRADRAQVEQIVLNLAINAGDAMPDGGVLMIETANADLDAAFFEELAVEAHPGPYVKLKVGDSGHGMDAATREHIFEPFFTTKGRAEGTGLGLATVYGIVKQHDGHIVVNSELRRGTTIEVYLPAVEGAGVPSRETTTEKVAARGNETVLVVEDDAMVRKLVCEGLRIHGYEILEAAGPREGIEIADRYEGDVHLLLTDVIMPDLNGRELRDELASRRPNLATLFISGYPADVIAQHGILDEEIRYLQKPFTVRDLLQTVRDSLD